MWTRPVGRLVLSLLGDVEDADFGGCLKERCELADHVGGEQGAGEVVVGVRDGVESVQDLDVLISDQKILGLCARHVGQQRLLVLVVHANGCSAVLVIDSGVNRQRLGLGPFSQHDLDHLAAELNAPRQNLAGRHHHTTQPTVASILRQGSSALTPIRLSTSAHRHE
jgi:hypothetical protein